MNGTTLSDLPRLDDSGDQSFSDDQSSTFRAGSEFVNRGEVRIVNASSVPGLINGLDRDDFVLPELGELLLVVGVTEFEDDELACVCACFGGACLFLLVFCVSLPLFADAVFFSSFLVGRFNPARRSRRRTSRMTCERIALRESDESVVRFVFDSKLSLWSMKVKDGLSCVATVEGDWDFAGCLSAAGKWC